MGGLKFLTDFDGVVTDLTDEALRVRHLFDSYLVELCGQDETHQCLTICQEQLRENPHLHGWRSGSRISAFANEDGFIYVNGLGACLDDRSNAGQTLPAKFRSALKKVEFESFTRLANHSYQTMVSETAKALVKPMDVGAGEVLKTLLSRGHQVVVVSNSGTERIRNILASSEVAEYLDGPDSPLSIRGNAQKFVLGDSDDCLQSEGYRVSVDRPIYRSILLEERPDVVVGDVFSLDLALPLALSLRGERPLRDTRMFLRKRHYTPNWSIQFMGELMRGAKGGILERFDELLGVT